jgi:hypothetical protein
MAETTALSSSGTELSEPAAIQGNIAMDIVDMTVHVDEELSPEQMQELEDAVRADACVISACNAHDNPHVLVVTFNPACTNRGNVLGRVQAQGVHAQLGC